MYRHAPSSLVWRWVIRAVFCGALLSQLAACSSSTSTTASSTQAPKSTHISSSGSTPVVSPTSTNPIVDLQLIQCGQSLPPNDALMSLPFPGGMGIHVKHWDGQSVLFERKEPNLSFPTLAPADGCITRTNENMLVETMELPGVGTVQIMFSGFQWARFPNDAKSYLVKRLDQIATSFTLHFTTLLPAGRSTDPFGIFGDIPYPQLDGSSRCCALILWKEHPINVDRTIRKDLTGFTDIDGYCAKTYHDGAYAYKAPDNDLEWSCHDKNGKQLSPRSPFQFMDEVSHAVYGKSSRAYMNDANINYAWEAFGPAA